MPDQISLLPIDVFRVDSHGKRIRLWLYFSGQSRDEYMHEPPMYLPVSSYNVTGGMRADLNKITEPLYARLLQLFPTGVPQDVRDAMTVLEAHLEIGTGLLANLVLAVDEHLDPGVVNHDGPVG